MKSVILAVCLTLSAVASGCALRGASSTANGLNTFDGVSETYPGDSQGFATSAALELAHRYPPGRTNLVLVRAPGVFGDTLETELRGHGFLVASGDTGTGLTVAYTIDEVQGEVPPKAYMRMQSSDGGVFGFVRPLLGTSMTSPAVPSPGVASEVAPYPLPLPATTPAISTSPVTPLRAETPSSGVLADVPMSSLHSSVPLTKGILTVLPSRWKYTIPDTEKRNVRVQEPGNAPWREAVKRMSADAGCEAQFDETARRVTVLSVAPSLPDVPPAVVPPVSSPATTPPTVANALVAFGDPVGSVEPGIADAIHLSPIPEEEWSITPGSLHSQLMRWGEKAGYQVVWKAVHDFDMEAHATFRGTFVSAIQKLFSGMHKSGNALRVTLYQENNVLEVGDE